MTNDVENFLPDYDYAEYLLISQFLSNYIYIITSLIEGATVCGDLEKPEVNVPMQ